MHGDNRLPTLADKASQEHSDSLKHAEKAVGHAIAAGEALIEAKELCKHGQWGKWLADTGIPERTAQRYMRLHHSGLKSATMADLGGIAEADRFIGWYRAEKLGAYDPQDVAECIIEGRRIRDEITTKEAR